ncbi:MAG: hypothetical protein HN352_08105 [Bacteroidetes bacterium]|jgi:hypothetical protein|nr:hypothetical protein [Bacteroidota bacterium]MBT4408272.1 hypothetical protein [Bacteroidota bacterium]MBT7466646.1 hypothetical protein [Bacteroidota bacterium]
MALTELKSLILKTTTKIWIAVILLFIFIACDTINQVENTKWLTKNNRAFTLSSEIDNFLKSLNGNIRLLYCKYDKADLIATHPFNIHETSINENKWNTRVEANSIKSDPDALDLNIQFQLIEGSVEDAGVAVAFDFKKWDTENYVLLPASVYNGNRCKIVNSGYAQGLDRKYLYQKNIPMMSVAIPHLALEKDSVSRLEVNASYLSTPAMCFYSKEKKRGFILLTGQKSQFGDNGFIVEESEDRKQASLIITAPGVLEKKPLFVGSTESLDRGVSLKAGDSIELNIRLYSFKANDIPEVLEKFMEVRKSLTGQNKPRNLIPFSQVADFMTKRIDERYYDGPEFQFYCPENANWISFGWIGGLMNTFPMLALNDERHLERVTKTFDFAIPRGQGEAGYFYGAINYDGKPFGREGYDEFPEIVLTRKNADVLFWMIKQFKLLIAQGKENSIKPEWEENIQRLADAFVSTWEKNAQWGRMINNQTGEVAEYNTSGGVMAIGGLALASEYYDKPEYLDIAIEAAHFYYQRDFYEQGSTTGGCADILQNADSETAAGFMTSLMALYEITGDREWLEKSRNLANLCATWTTSYDYQLPKNTELGKLDAKLAGVYWASTQNKHGAPGICTSSGDPLFKIYRNTGNILYADLMNDIVHAHGESIRPGGYTNERLTYCDADSKGERGIHITGWNELNGLLMALEIPGIYLQTDGELFYVFDHVEANIEEHDKNGVTLLIKNPTSFDASVSILTESTKQAEKPLGYNAFINWPMIKIQAGDSLRVSINRDGNITSK